MGEEYPYSCPVCGEGAYGEVIGCVHGEINGRTFTPICRWCGEQIERETGRYRQTRCSECKRADVYSLGHTKSY